MEKVVFVRQTSHVRKAHTNLVRHDVWHRTNEEFTLTILYTYLQQFVQEHAGQSSISTSLCNFHYALRSPLAPHTPISLIQVPTLPRRVRIC
jgi:hypothetical protein